MAETSGLELVQELRRLRSNLPSILTTGYIDVIAESGAGGRPMILKPYRLETLADALDNILDDGRARADG